MKLSLIVLIACTLLFSCSQNEPVIPVDPNRGVDGNDDLQPNPDPSPNPTPRPTPTPPQEAMVVIEPSSLAKDDTTLVYRKVFKVVGLGEPRSDHKNCDSQYEDQCTVNQQILWQFDTTKINQSYPSELWNVGRVEMTGSYYSIGKNHRTELLCLLNNKICSGKAISKVPRLGLPFLKILWRNQKFWSGRDEDHVKNQLFHDTLISGQQSKELYIIRNHTFDFSRVFSMKATEVQTLVRKNEGIQLSVTDDTYVEEPILKVFLKRRLPRN